MDEDPAAIALLVGAALTHRPSAPLGTRLGRDELVGAVRALGSAGLVTSPEHAPAASAVAEAAGVALHVLEGLPDRGEVPDRSGSLDEVVAIVHTSGTTGAPKPIFARQGTLAARLDVYERTMPMGPGDRYCSASPLHHTAGISMALTALGRGATVIPQAWFSVDGWRQAGRLGVTHALLVPTMIDLLLAQGALGAARPKVLQYGAAPIDPRTLIEAMAALPDVELLQIFGQTEVSPITALWHADHVRGLEEPAVLRTVGRAVPGVELRLESADEEGIGELTVRAPHGWAPDPDGWRRTGDLGTIDGDGYVRLHGRAHDRIVRGGENIYPVEVERAIAAHPAVREVAVVGVPDGRYGEAVKVVVVPVDPAAPPTLDELYVHARARLAPFKAPTLLEVVDELPRNEAGKLLRGQLVDPAR